MINTRYLLVLGLLILTLLALAAGVNAGLEHLTKAPVQNSFVIYDGQGQTLYAYNGDFSGSAVSIRPVPNALGPRFLHRT